MSKVILTITGKTAAGKSTLERKVCEQYGFKRMVSHTTRPMREGETDGDSYHFVDEDVFFRLKNTFVEVNRFAGNYYGLSQAELDAAFAENLVPVVVVESNGLHHLSMFAQDNDIKLVTVFLDGDTRTLIDRFLDRDELTEDKALNVSQRVFKLMTSEQYMKEDYPTWDMSFNGFGRDTERRVVNRILKTVDRRKAA